MPNWSKPGRYDPKATCPWEGPLTSKVVAPGIWWVSAPGHAGYLVSEERYAAMPQKYRDTSFTGDQYFEEDVSWCGVVLAFKDELAKDNPGMLEAARQTFENFYGGDQ
jgi:hypothetical protein